MDPGLSIIIEMLLSKIIQANHSQLSAYMKKNDNSNQKQKQTSLLIFRVKINTKGMRLHVGSCISSMDSTYQ